MRCAHPKKKGKNKHIWASAFELDQTLTFFHAIIRENFVKASKVREDVGVPFLCESLSL